LECRIKGAAKNKSKGFATLQDLIDFDHRAFWKENIQLRRVKKLEQVGRAVCGRDLRDKMPWIKEWRIGKKKLSMDVYRRIGTMFLRGHCQLGTEWGGCVSVQKLLDYGKHLEPNRLVGKIDNRVFLPTTKRVTLLKSAVSEME
jgi:hypothetical protein